VWASSLYCRDLMVLKILGTLDTNLL
jgi:hypothetical protein